MIKSKNILEQEEEFLKLNAEIDSKTKELMSQVDRIKETQLTNEELDWIGSKLAAQAEKKAENHLQAGSPANLCEDVFAVNGFSSRRNVDEDSNGTTDLTKDRIRTDSKLGTSTRISHSLVGMQAHESMLSLGIIRQKSDLKLKKPKVDNDVIPDTLKGVGHDGVVKFLSAKVKLLTEQLQVIQRDEKKHLEKIKELQAHKDKSVEERDKLIHQANMNKNMLVKLEQHINNVTAQLQASQAENSSLKKELENLKREIRQSNKTHSTNDVKLKRSLDEIERLKAILQQMKQDEKEFREAHKKKTEDLSNTIKNLDRQRTELLNGFKKQLLIIDNLKRQKGLIEAGKILKSAEDDFISYLDCNPPNTVRQTDAIKSAKS